MKIARILLVALVIGFTTGYTLDWAFEQVIFRPGIITRGP